MALLALVLGAGPASAHAALVSSDPEDGSSMAAAPRIISLTFNENVATPAYVAVTAPDGSTVSVKGVEAVDRTVTADVADVGQRGRYSASYRVVSSDGHPISGTFTYEVRQGRIVAQVDGPKSQSFLHRHKSHFIWGTLAAAAAIVLLLSPLRRRNDPESA